MSEPESTPLSLITDAVSSIPEPVRKPLCIALKDLLSGLVSVPAAKLKQYAQGIEDVTAARTKITNAIVASMADEVSNDPEVMQAASEIYLPTTVRKLKNRLGVAKRAVEHVAKADVDTNGEGCAAPDDDWMNCFSRFAEDASSERLQDLFGRILAGEVLRPGAFGLATLRILSELDQTLANDFTQAWSKSVGNAVDYSHEWSKGDEFSRWKRLSEAGLMAPDTTTQYLPPFKPLINGSSLWSPTNVDGVGLLVYFQEKSSSTWKHIDFTRAGRELGSILPKPDYENNIREVARRLPKQGLTQIDFFSNGKNPEVIWKSSS
ncbi:DUF2806 domain-containing protein [Billgrantia desiderata]|uniref:DUF2806 domain-containing protein n=1 Tax=Billgrantia desiderata TaxID=52021 RepID=UPI00089F2805|nr:DUF2806 domain-containing protein [Halomonas desiderata]SEG29941.1 Protein of unknown function [Halomonas desiderata]